MRSLGRVAALVLLLALPSCAKTAGPNSVALFLRGAERQTETADQMLQVRQALHDMIDLGVDDLRGRRYPDYTMTPGQWPVTVLLSKYFVPGTPMELDEEAFYRDVGKSEARVAIQEQIQAIDKAMKSMEVPGTARGGTPDGE
jgi:hypothetical protein